jgi:hypothetical protein
VRVATKPRQRSATAGGSPSGVPVEPVARGRTAAERWAAPARVAPASSGCSGWVRWPQRVAVRRGGMACAAKKVRQPPEARPCVAWSTVSEPRATFVHRASRGYKLPLLARDQSTTYPARPLARWNSPSAVPLEGGRGQQARTGTGTSTVPRRCGAGAQRRGGGGRWCAAFLWPASCSRSPSGQRCGARGRRHGRRRGTSATRTHRRHTS